MLQIQPKKHGTLPRGWFNGWASVLICPKPTGHINPFPAESSNLNFHPLEVVSRYRDPQLQVGEKFSQIWFISD